MAKDLVVVESPAKARTIGQILGSEYVVKASLGHVRDLPKDAFGVKTDDGFTPHYVLVPERRAVVRELKELAKDASLVYLATDPDREGEAISWHVVQATGVRAAQVRRVVFHEITEGAVREAFRHPRDIDLHLVDAQQARRILDRLVGYTLSPLLSKKLRWWGLSAGRVQSAALRLVVDREREVQAFVPKEYWTVEAILTKEQQSSNGQPLSFKAILHALLPKGYRAGQKVERLDLPGESNARQVVQDLDGAGYSVAGVNTREVRTTPAPPFITSTLQQEAWRKLRFPARKTMMIAQQLYEGMSVGGEGPVGLITYMRTDSTHVAESALQEARRYIGSKFDPPYLPKRARVYTRKVKGAQEAHEAIRPTSVHRDLESLRPYLNAEQLRLYDLVWKRFLASQMADALSEATRVDTHAATVASSQTYLFRAAGSQLRFPGFRILYLEAQDEVSDTADEGALPSLNIHELLRCLGVESKQHFTQPPPRNTESSLIRALEERGIGRPSTYAAIVSTIQERDYAKKDGGRFTPSPLGMAVNDLLAQQFSDVVALDFTAHMEEELDDIASGQREWNTVLKDFYGPFKQDLQQADQAVVRVDIPTGESCEVCGRPMVWKRGRFGPFLSCSGYPDCRNAKPIQSKVGVECPSCGGDLVERRARKGKRRSVFYGCSNYPTCNFAVNRRPLPTPCPDCGGLLLDAGRGLARCNKCPFRGPVSEASTETVGA
ncbi:MAG: type I DNA topoisomerase [Chloroflexi bacterium]|nr:type I DNA topoisomerase [Chloroflexota bacterium]